ncbi:MAG: DNA recombination protein RmuC [Gammaproteobacteria bacterium]|nr:DNA recombination protein RmuC [Gammaproteobacteria bacterium]
MNEFLAVPHHQLLIGMGIIALLVILQWITSGRRAARREQRLIDELTASRAADLGPVVERIQAIEARVDAELARARHESAEQAAALRREVLQSISTLGGTQQQQIDAFGRRLQLDARAAADSQKEQLASFEQRLATLTTSLAGQLEKLRAENSTRLEEMRRTVDEKLQSTLEKRLGESFNQVSERLEAVHKGLGEMQRLATGVGDLKRVLTNVRSRGSWGEVQLGQLLEDMLTPEQYGTNVAVVPGSAERVEFAIRLPGDGEAPVWLPIDAKFPREDYERLIAASDLGDTAAVEVAVKALETRVLAEAKGIAERYLAPPHTTDFAILYLPTEGLYAEVTRRVGLADRLQRDHRVVIAGPSTFSALLNSLQMGFRTLAIQQRSGEVWKILGAVKTEFGRFGDTLDKVKKKLHEASNHMDSVDRRTRVMSRHLRDVEALPASTSVSDLLGGDAEED